ncbi:MAG: hypothetical protein ACP5R1_07815 [Athalassotoga sp.]
MKNIIFDQRCAKCGSYGKRHFKNCEADKKQKYTDDPVKTILDSFGICAFAYKNLKIEDLVKIINANTGSQFTKENILEMADILK